MSEAIGTE